MERKHEQRLPTPMTRGGMSLAESLARRRSLREFTSERLTEEQLGQLCWAAQGITSPEGFRTAPSAGAILPFTLLVASPAGVAAYHPKTHSLRWLMRDDIRLRLQTACLDQPCVGSAPAVFVLAVDLRAMEAKYGGRAEYYGLLEAGHIAQNLLLQATALGLGGVPVGAFYEPQVKRVLQLDGELRPLYLLPVGHPRFPAAS